MKLFTDTTGQEWEISLTIGSVKKIRERIRQELDLDFLSPTTFITRIDDPVTAADVLYLICQTQADRLGIDSAEFGGRLAGLKLWEAIRALREEYIDFFPDPTVQKSLRAVIDEKEDVLDQSWTLMASQFAQQSRQAAEDFEKSLRDLRVSPESVSTTI